MSEVLLPVGGRNVITVRVESTNISGRDMAGQPGLHLALQLQHDEHSAEVAEGRSWKLEIGTETQHYVRPRGLADDWQVLFFVCRLSAECNVVGSNQSETVAFGSYVCCDTSASAQPPGTLGSKSGSYFAVIPVMRAGVLPVFISSIEKSHRFGYSFTFAF